MQYIRILTSLFMLPCPYLNVTHMIRFLAVPLALLDIPKVTFTF